LGTALIDCLGKAQRAAAVKRSAVGRNGAPLSLYSIVQDHQAVLSFAEVGYSELKTAQELQYDYVTAFLQGEAVLEASATKT
jgi:hypothetical protein